MPFVSRLFSKGISLRMAIPCASAAVALILCGLTISASLISATLRANSDSQLAARRLAVIVQPDVQAGDLAGLEHLLENFSDVNVAIVTPEGELLAGRPPETARFRVAIPDGQGQLSGWLVTGQLVPTRLSMPAMGIVAFVFFAVLMACLYGVLLFQRVKLALDKLEARAGSLGNRRGAGSVSTYTSSLTEFRRIDALFGRAISRVLRESDELRARVYVNPISGLPNFTALNELLNAELKVADFDRPIALMRIEIDGFNSACDSLGAEVEVELRQAVIERVRGELSGLALGRDAFFGQPWNDDFVIVLTRPQGRAEVSTVARALRSAFVRPFRAGGHDLLLGVSGGIVMAPEDGGRPEDLLRRAEIALNSVRDGARRGFCFYAPRLDRVAKGRVLLEAEIREAVRQGEFTPSFQPKFDLRSGHVSGCEALARWYRPGGRTVSPAAFIPVAEETGLIEQIGASILRQSCRAAAEWLRDGLDVPVAVNVSPLQLRSETFRQTVIDALTESGLPPHHLELELTETAAIEDPDRFREVFGPLRALGVRLAVDDFGTGHSNLALLSRLPFDVFKIDRQFISSLERDQGARPIVEMILAMAESLGLQTVAEGVETPVQARFLRARGCTYAQGFLYSPPLSLDEFPNFVRTWQARRSSAGRNVATGTGQ